MANKKKKEEDLRNTKSPMHCNACERTVAKIISMFKGWRPSENRYEQTQVVVTGRIDPQKLLKKLKKKTRKEVEIVANKKEEEGSKDTTSRTEEINVASESFPQQYLQYSLIVVKIMIC
ncbi:hypothetical protein D5086_019090 [Populus alba]|uniref:Uncharacterized protein n=1 Tax=Populus alba TaxID=43335 RepID=A0ACC4BGU4_POPAL